jgi:hypothetical protein
MLLIFIVNDRNVDVYRRIKKSCDIRFGVASQVLQAKHVMSASPQYISNVCMKVNAKLGGATSVAKSNLSKQTHHRQCLVVIRMLIPYQFQSSIRRPPQLAPWSLVPMFPTLPPVPDLERLLPLLPLPSRLIPYSPGTGLTFRPTVTVLR